MKDKASKRIAPRLRDGGKRKAIKGKAPHWTQRPENKARVLAWMRKMSAIRDGKVQR